MFTNLNRISRGIIFCLVLIAITAIGGCKEDNGGGNTTHQSSSSTIKSASSGGGPVIPNPEPSTWLLLGSGMAGMGIWQWVKSKKNRK